MTRHHPSGTPHFYLLPFAFCLLPFCVLPLRCLAAQSTDEKVAAHFNAGRAALKQGDPAKAVEEFKKVVALDPKLVEAHVNLGLAYHSLGEYSLAAAELAPAIKQRPDLAGINVILGIDYLKLGWDEKAIPVLRQALTADPSNPEALEALARCYTAGEDFKHAVEEDRQLAAVNSDKAGALYTLGHNYLDLAARLAYRGAKIESNSPWGHRFLGDLLGQRNRWNDAVAEYQQGLDLDPLEPGLHAALGEAYLNAGKTEKAEKPFRAELQLDPASESAWLGLAEMQLVAHHAVAALDAISKLWEASPEFLALQRDFPSIALPPEAASGLESDLASASEGAPRQFLMAALSEAAGASARAQEHWASFQRYADAREKTAASAAPSGDPCRARRYAECARSLSARKQLSASERMLLGRTQITLRQYEAAADTFAQVLWAQKGNVEASYWLARCYYALGADCFARLAESFPDSWRAHQLRAEGYDLRQDSSNAIQEYRRALEMQPEDADLHAALGEIYLRKKTYDQAELEFEKSLAIRPSRAQTLCSLGRLYVAKRENEKALPYLQKAVRYQPDLAEARNLLGTAYVRLGQDAKAVPELEKAAPFDFYGDVHYQLSVAYRKLGRMELAQKALARSEELRRSSAAIHQATVSGVAAVE